MGPWRESGVVAVPGDGPVSWTAREDAAEAAALVLLSDGAYDGPTTITAMEAPTFEEAAAMASEVTGRPVTFTVVGEEEWLAARLNAGEDEWRARFTIGIYQAAQQDFFAGVDPLLSRLLDRQPRTVRDLLG
jgi:uncharacterized protein YbjT (DUF2867 family)